MQRDGGNDVWEMRVGMKCLFYWVLIMNYERIEMNYDVLINGL